MADLSGIGSIIMDYWQGMDLLAELGFQAPDNAMCRHWRGCTHTFPCAHGVPYGKCVWMDQWAHEWVKETRNNNPHQNDWLAEHCDSWGLQRGMDWTPDNWADWEVLRAHRCDFEDDAYRLELDDEDDAPAE